MLRLLTSLLLVLSLMTLLSHTQAAPPEAAPTVIAAMVCPGGGYALRAMDLEGKPAHAWAAEAATWLKKQR